MKKGINYWAFPAKADGSPFGQVQAIARAKALGYDCLELTVEAEGPLSPKASQADVTKIRKAAEDCGLELLTVASGLAWGESPTDPDPAVRARAVENYRRTLEICSWLGARTLLYLPGMVSACFIPGFAPQPSESVATWAREAVEALLPTAERLKVTLAVENVWNRFLLSPLEMKAFIDQFGSDSVGSYFDVGNVLLYGHPEDWIRTLGKRIAAVHMKDFRTNVGNLDGFVDLLSGDVNFRAVMGALRAVGYTGPYTAEIVPGKEGAVEKAFVALKIIENY
jgi:L-ribulose-5-phosphate 3-epimerase